MLHLVFGKNITCLQVGLLRICQVSSVSCKTVCQWVMTLLFHERYVSYTTILEI